MLDFIIFGGVGDLSVRKLLPSFYYLYRQGNLPPKSRILCVSRWAMTRIDFLNLVEEKLREFLADEFDYKIWQGFKEILRYEHIDLSLTKGWPKLVDYLSINQNDKNRSIIYYLSLPPPLFIPICEQIKAHQLNPDFARIVVEKPLGENYGSAKTINEIFADSFNEQQIYRIDHFLGKSPVKNILPLRFDDPDMNAIWNKKHIKSVEITVSEIVGVEGRSEFLDRAGILKDMFQNHLMQLLTLVAMEKPKTFDADHVRDAKLSVIKSLRPINEDTVQSHTIKAQYGAGKIHGQNIPSYRHDLKRSKNKVAGIGETYVALKVHVDNDRWQNVPFYLRSGKRLSARFAEIIIHFNDREDLNIKIQPLAKISDNVRRPEAYEVLLLDVIKGDQTNFVRGDEIMASWHWIDQISAAWKNTDMPMQKYPAGSTGLLLK